MFGLLYLLGVSIALNQSAQNDELRELRKEVEKFRKDEKKRRKKSEFK